MNPDPYAQRRIRKTSAKIDLGCGPKCAGGFTGIDFKDHGQDILWDIREGIPLPDNSVTDIFSSHFVEHLSDQELITFWGEVSRVCKDGANVRIHCPHSDSTESMYPSHVSLWNGKRVRGACLASKNNAKVRKYFELLTCVQVGIELQVVLKVHFKKP